MAREQCCDFHHHGHGEKFGECGSVGPNRAGRIERHWNTLSGSAVTNGSGVATFSIKSTEAELKTITATVTLNPGSNLNQLNARPTVSFIADASTLNAGASTAIANPPTAYWRTA